MFNIAVIGYGLTGSTLIPSLVAAADAIEIGLDIRIIDYDIIEHRNVVANLRIPDIGRKKAHVGADLVTEWGHQAKAVTQKVTGKNVESVLSGSDLVIGCVDNVHTRQIVWVWAIGSGIPYMDIGVSVTGGQVTWEHDMPYRPNVYKGGEKEDVKNPPCDLIGTRPTALMATSLAAYSAMAFLIGNDPNRVVKAVTGKESIPGEAKISWFINRGDTYTIRPVVHIVRI